MDTTINILPFKRLEEVQGFFAFTTTRQGGVSQGPYASLNLGLHVGDDPKHVLANRAALLPHLKAARPVCAQQVHGTNILRVEQEQAGLGWESFESGVKECDGMITSEHGLALALSVADCLGLVAVDAKKKVFGVAHAGWRGALAKIGQKLVRALKEEFDCDSKDLLVGLGPCLGPCCLELEEEQLQDFNKAFPASWEFHAPLVDKHFNLDLWKLISLQLEEEGVSASNLEIQNFCTQETPDLFYSHRRDNGKTGRMLQIAGFSRKSDPQYVF